jgi:hypothetical protein
VGEGVAEPDELLSERVALLSEDVLNGVGVEASVGVDVSDSVSEAGELYELLLSEEDKLDAIGSGAVVGVWISETVLVEDELYELLLSEEDDLD